MRNVKLGIAWLNFLLRFASGQLAGPRSLGHFELNLARYFCLEAAGLV